MQNQSMDARELPFGENRGRACGAKKACGCLSGDSWVHLPNGGQPIALRDLDEASDSRVLTLKEAGQLVAQRPASFRAGEPEQLFKLTTQSGRSIEATTRHPFLTRDGWKPLTELTVADRVAVIAEHPNLFGHRDCDEDRLRILAYLAADSAAVEGPAPVLTQSDPEVRRDFEAAVEAMGDECAELGDERGVVRLRVRGKSGGRNNVADFVEEIGLKGGCAADKALPDFAFELRRGRLQLFLNRLFTCDGFIEAFGLVHYNSASAQKVRQVQHLLGRFGVGSSVRDRYLQGKICGAELTVSGKSNLLAFIDEIGFFGLKALHAEHIRAALASLRGREGQLDRVGVVLFDRVISIEPSAVAPVFELRMAGSNNCIANDFVVRA